MALLEFTGFEHQKLEADGFGISATPPSISTTTFYSGAAALRFNAAGTGVTVLRNLSTPSIVVLQAMVRFASFPAGDVWIVHVENDTQWVDFKYVAGSGLVIDAYDGVSNPQSSAWALSLNTWYRLGLLIDASTNPWSVKGRVDSSEKTLAPAFAATTFSRAYLGWYQSTTADMFLDDLVLFTGSAADYPVTASQVLGYSPNATGIHLLDASPSSFFFQHDGATGTALTTAETTSYTRIDDVPISGSSDYLYITGTPGATQYAEVQFANEAGNYNVTAVRVIEAVRQATAGGSAYTSKATDDHGTSLTTLQSAFDPNSSTEVFKRATMTTKPSGGAWTKSSFADLRYRIGFTSDATPEIQLRSVIAEALLTTGSSAIHNQLLGIG